MVYKHAYLNTSLLLHSAFMLSLVMMLLKGVVGGRALNGHGNYIVDHGKIMELCLCFSVGTKLKIDYTLETWNIDKR